VLDTEGASSFWLMSLNSCTSLKFNHGFSKILASYTFCFPPSFVSKVMSYKVPETTCFFAFNTLTNSRTAFCAFNQVKTEKYNIQLILVRLNFISIFNLHVYLTTSHYHDVKFVLKISLYISIS